MFFYLGIFLVIRPCCLSSVNGGKSQVLKTLNEMGYIWCYCIVMLLVTKLTQGDYRMLRERRS